MTTHLSHRRLGSRLLARFWPAMSAFITVGCASVNPAADYQRAAQLVAERTGGASPFDPQAAGDITSRVEALLADGLTVEEAVRVALLNNRDFQGLFAEIGASRADVVQSQLLSNPTLALGFQFPAGGGLTDFTLGFAEQLAELWQIPIRRKIAEAELEQAILRAGQRAVELAATVRERCYAVLALRRAVDYAEENGRLAQQAVQLAEAQFAAGEVSSFDVNLTRSSLLDVQDDLISLHGEQRQAQADLAQILGLSRHASEWRLTDELPAGWDSPIDAQRLVDQALDDRFDAQMARFAARRAEQMLRLELRKFLTDVQIGLALERSEQRALPDRQILADTARASIASGALTAPDIQTRGERNVEKSQIIDAKLGPTVALTLPIFDQNQAQIEKARVRALQARTQYEGVLDAIAADVQRAAAAAQTASERLHFQKDQGIPQAETTLAGAEARYRSGEQGVLVLIEAQDALVRRRRAHVTTLRDYAIAMARLEGAVGGRRPSPAATPPATTQP